MQENSEGLRTWARSFAAKNRQSLDRDFEEFGTWLRGTEELTPEEKERFLDEMASTFRRAIRSRYYKRTLPTEVR